MTQEDRPIHDSPEAITDALFDGIAIAGGDVGPVDRRG